ncbi:hypothetical protein B1B_06335, partial [mine drainage metagenome]
MVQAEPPGRPVPGTAKPTPSPPTPAPTEEGEGATESMGRRSIELAGFYHGKMETVPSVPIRSLADFSLWYTPGIAAVSRAIEAAPDRSFDLTGRWN